MYGYKLRTSGLAYIKRSNAREHHRYRVSLWSRFHLRDVSSRVPRPGSALIGFAMLPQQIVGAITSRKSLFAIQNCLESHRETSIACVYSSSLVSRSDISVKSPSLSLSLHLKERSPQSPYSIFIYLVFLHILCSHVCSLLYFRFSDVETPD